MTNTTPQRFPLLWLLAAALLLTVFAVALYKGWDTLFPPVAVFAEPDPDCDLRQGPCLSTLPSGATIRFDITPRSLPTVAPLQLQVETQGLDAESVKVDFTGVDMNMGFLRPELPMIAPGLFQGGAMLPVCVRTRMAWEARVLVQTDDGLIAAAYRFDTIKQ